MIPRRHTVYIGDSRDLGVIEDSSMDLVVTSPPYWHIKDYGCKEQIGHGQDLHSYLKDLFLVWKECVRTLSPGRRICINIGDQFARSSIYGRYKVIPLHSEIISQMEQLDMDFMGSIIWNKRTTMNTSGGAVIMGSYPYPPNGIVEIDYEFILIFKKPGPSPKRDKAIKEMSRMTKEEWKRFHSGHWTFGGARQVSHEAMFPVELPSRLIRMFTFKDEKVLDPFLGSGTTIQAAHENGRVGVGFELNRDFVPIMKKRFGRNIDVGSFELEGQEMPEHDTGYIPAIRNADPPEREVEKRDLIRVRGITDNLGLMVEDRREITLAGIDISDHTKAREYLERFVIGKEISVEEAEGIEGDLVFLKNRIYINGELVKGGLATVMIGDFPARKRLLGILRKIKKDSF